MTHCLKTFCQINADALLLTILFLFKLATAHVSSHTARCPPLTSSSVLISCVSGTNVKDCGEQQLAGTVARLQCKPGFTNGHQVAYKEIVCLETATWNRPVFTCFPDCGKRRSVAESGAEDTRVLELPWHVAVYRVNGTTHTHHCAGSLITPTVVVSAAHCFWNMASHNQPMNITYKVVAGSLSREWEDSDPSVQRREVLRVDTPGATGIFESDIAVVHLKEAVEITNSVGLVCVDWGTRAQLRFIEPGSVGVFAGWFLAGASSRSSALRYVELQHVPWRTCAREHPSTGPMNDKFCVSANSSTGVCAGDSGGGLVFLSSSSDKYFLRGVASLPLKSCRAHGYSVFTLVDKYFEWIQRHM